MYPDKCVIPYIKAIVPANQFFLLTMTHMPTTDKAIANTTGRNSEISRKNCDENNNPNTAIPPAIDPAIFLATKANVKTKITFINQAANLGDENGNNVK